MRFLARLATAVVGLAAAGLAATAPATAAPATGVEDVVAALGLTSEPADYVVLADTSGSMNAGGRYARMRHELRTLVTGLDSDDRVSLLTFDSTVESRFRGVVGDDPAAVFARLPDRAAGLHTDIGAAIDAGLAELERSDTHRLAALILITDGELDAPGSAYESAKSQAWKDLRTRASALAKDHQVAAYAVSLQASTDAALLKKVFPRAREVAAAQVGDRFAGVGQDLLRLQAAEALKNEVTKAIGVTWTGDLGVARATGAAVDVQLEIASPYPHVPVSLSDLTVHAAEGLQVELAGLPDRIDLDPGERVTLPVQATVSGSVPGEVMIGLAATVDSPWRAVMEEELGLTFAPSLDGSTVVPAPAAALPPTLLPLVPAVAGLAVVVALVLLGARALLIPPMSGVLTLSRDGQGLGEVVLSGRRIKLAAPGLVGLTGTATGARGAGRQEAAVRLAARFGDVRLRGRVADGASRQFGDLTVTYTSGRRRILDKIGLLGAGHRSN